jgi:aspartyl-tRNA(Asn)/glutamyl-tRNA(Gln) amidotransferase subunit B
VERAIQYETERQIELIEKGEKVIQETRGWDDAHDETYSQRTKESSHDYRYFPDPDIPKMKISEIPEFSTASLSESLPELPWVKRERYHTDYGMTDKEVAVFVGTPIAADYFEKTIEPFKKDAKKVKLAVNYILNDYLGPANAGADIELIPHTSFSEIVTMIDASEISSRGAKDLIGLLLKDSHVTPRELASQKGLLQKSDAADIEPAIEKILADNAKVVAEYKSGKVASIQFLIGQAMKATKGAANPTVIKELLMKKLG